MTAEPTAGARWGARADGAPAAGVDTLTALLERAAGSDERGLRFLDRRERATFLSWRRVHGGAAATAARLRRLGVRPGDRVALVFPTGSEFFDGFFGALLAGAVPVPLYPPVRLGRLGEYHRRTAAMIEAAGARVVLAERRVRRILGRTVEAARPELGCLTPSALAHAGGPEPPAGSERPAAGGDLALVQFSSGTTVEPKPVALSHRAVLAQVRLLNRFWPDTDELTHSGVSWLPLYHDMGLIGCVFPAVERVADLTLVPPELFVARPAVWLRAISRFGATISPAPNFAYGLCVSKVRDEELEGVDLSCWRVALNGAESVSAATVRAFTERFRPFGFRPEALTPVYGLSEAALAVTFSPLDRPPLCRRFVRASLEPGRKVEPVPEEDGGSEGRELVSVGSPLPGFELEVREPGEAQGGEDEPPSTGEGREPLPAGRVGRIHVRGPSLMEGYLGRPDATAEVLSKGWLDTGDLGFLDGGELYLTGRAKDLVILRGRNYAPEEIEAAAGRAAGVRRGCTVAASWVGREDQKEKRADSERLVVLAEVDRRAGPAVRRALPEAVHEEVLARIGVAPDRVVALEPGTLPRTSSGKLRRGEALRRWLAGSLEPPAPVTPLRLAGAVLGSGAAFARLGLGRAFEEDLEENPGGDDG